eukprot:TRINITY_DN7849_c0_g1_i1.p3 TRINITY_DN7849_c0_g1~~TRINITY_DN7849_c0_g1_i1.p3  ORF type:complete len:119 (-),score=14.23 TRINITY_DN7849_c0_g1_i1:38-394(-)
MRWWQCGSILCVSLVMLDWLKGLIIFWFITMTKWVSRGLWDLKASGLVQIFPLHFVESLFAKDSLPSGYLQHQIDYLNGKLYIDCLLSREHFYAESEWEKICHYTQAYGEGDIYFLPK